jgi:hypothetical protein
MFATSVGGGAVAGVALKGIGQYAIRPGLNRAMQPLGSAPRGTVANSLYRRLLPIENVLRGDASILFATQRPLSRVTRVASHTGLSDNALDARIIHATLFGNGRVGVAKRNIAVVEYLDPKTNTLRRVTKFSRDGKHAEARAIEVVQRRLGKQGAANNIRQVYTELSPCGPQYKNCGAFIAKNAPNALVSFDGVHPFQAYEHEIISLQLQDFVVNGLLRRMNHGN